MEPTENTNEEADYSPSVPHHLTLSELIRMLADLPQDAAIYGADLSYEYQNQKMHYYPDFQINPSNQFAWDIGFTTFPSPMPVTVGLFLDFLMDSLGLELDPENGEYLAVDECYVWMLDNDSGAVNGIRTNSDGTYTISTRNPNIM